MERDRDKTESLGAFSLETETRPRISPISVRTNNYGVKHFRDNIRYRTRIEEESMPDVKNGVIFYKRSFFDSSHIVTGVIFY